MKKIISFLLLSTFMLLSCDAKNIVNTNAQMHSEYSILNNDNNIIEFTNNGNIKISKQVDIPPMARIKAQIIQSQKERRMHKSGFLICKLLNYAFEDKTIDISDYEVYLIARKYEKADKKEIAITITEIILMSGASFFAPGVDIGYFFIKGALQRKKDPNWFRAGVMNAYDNSVFWFFQKGKPIDLAQNDEIKLKYLEKTKAKNMSAKITYKKDKMNFKKEKRIVKKEIREIKKEYNKEIKKAEKIYNAI